MNAIEVKHLTYKYNNDQSNVLNDITFNVKNGEWLSIIGPNGSGKSTLMKALDGLINIKRGSIIIEGINYDHNYAADQIRSKIGVVFQNPDSQFIESIVEDDVAFGLENRNIDFHKMRFLVNQSLELVDMIDYKKYQPENLSGGQKQRIALAGLIAIKPKIIILDEATSMLDPNGKTRMLKLVQKIKNKFHLTVISITHDINEVAYSDHTLVLKRGKIIEDGPSDEILNNSQLLLSNGLDIPFYRKLIRELLKKGIKVPDNIKNETELKKWIIQLISKR